MRLCREYRVRRLRFDRMQAEQMTGNLARAGVRPIEYVFSSAGADRLARSLFVALRDRSVELPDDEELRNEAMAVRMVETGPGTVKMRNPPGTHDDVLTAVGMVLVDLFGQPDLSPGAVWSPASASARVDAAPSTMRGLPSLIAVSTPRSSRLSSTTCRDSANDPRRVTAGQPSPR